MKPIKAGIILFFLINALYGQDTLYYQSGKRRVVKVTEVLDNAIRYTQGSGIHQQNKLQYKSSLKKIVFSNGLTEDCSAYAVAPALNYKTIIETKYDSSFVKKNFVRIYITNLSDKELRLGYERLLNKDFSFDADAMYRWPSKQLRVGNEPSQTASYPKNYWNTYINAYSEGFELRAGVSRHLNTKARRISLGLLGAYRQEGLSDVIVWNGNNSWPAYYMSQKSKGPGLILKLNYQHRPQHSGLELFAQLGFYAMNNSNNYHWYREYSSSNNVYITNPQTIPGPSYTGFNAGNWQFLQGRLGLSYVIKQPRQKGLEVNPVPPEGLFYKRKNAFFYNLLSLLDGANGISYMRVFYKPGISLLASGNIGNGTKPFFTNAALNERSLLYRFDKKNFDYSIGINYNLSTWQQSFFYVGLMARLAQFEGTYHFVNQFTDNRYYAMANVGALARGNYGLSFNVNFSLGHYENVYIHNNPWPIIRAENFQMRNPNGINWAFLSLALGYSF